jgi:hypothetical protein
VRPRLGRLILFVDTPTTFHAASSTPSKSSLFLTPKIAVSVFGMYQSVWECRLSVVREIVSGSLLLIVHRTFSLLGTTLV